MKPLAPLLAALLVLAPLAAWAEPCTGFAGPNFKPAGSGKYVYSDRDFKDSCRELWGNAGYVNSPSALHLELIEKLAQALHEGRARGQYKWFAASVILRTGPDAAKPAGPFIEGPSWQTTKDETVPGEPVYTAKSSEMDLANFYEDNDWEMKPEGQEKIKAAAAAVAAIQKPSSASGVPGRVRSIKIFASCSRMPNSGKAERLTFKELADKRALTAARLLAKALDLEPGDGRELSEDDLRKQFAADVEGLNHDGTSGPASPFDDPEDCGAGYDPIPDEVKTACAVASKAPAGASAKAALGQGWTNLPRETKKKLRSAYYDPAKYVKIHVDYETVDAKPTQRVVTTATPVKALINILEASKPEKPSKIPKWKPVPMRLRGRTDCRDPNRGR